MWLTDARVVDVVRGQVLDGVSGEISAGVTLVNDYPPGDPIGGTSVTVHEMELMQGPGFTPNWPWPGPPPTLLASWDWSRRSVLLSRAKWLIWWRWIKPVVGRVGDERHLPGDAVWSRGAR